MKKVVHSRFPCLDEPVSSGCLCSLPTPLRPIVGGALVPGELLKKSRFRRRQPGSLQGALELAAQYRELLRPFCERLELAGALRRGRFNWRAPEETCLEFLAIPRRRFVADSPEGLPAHWEDDLQAALVELVAQEEFVAPGVVIPARAEGCYRLLNEACALRLWVAAPRNFGSLWLWRTGSRAHTEWLCERARRRRLCWVPQAGLGTGLRIWGAGEEEIYHGLGLRFIPPRARDLGVGANGEWDLPEEAGA